LGPFYADAGPVRGPFLHRDVPGAIGVLEARDSHLPVGMALCTGRNFAGVALWRLLIDEIELLGRWVVIDREFVLAQ
jgi:hypothetical protein